MPNPLLESELVLFPRLSTRSKRAMQRKRSRFGHPYQYRPRITLVERLASEMGWSREQVMDTLQRERRKLLAD